MKILILKDKVIKAVEMTELKNKYSELIKDATGIKVTYTIQAKDYTTYPTYIDSDGDTRPTDNWLRAVTNDVYTKYTQDIDHVVILIHEDNWLSDTDFTKGIWGTNYSNIYSGYQVHYCRYDRDNMANSLGTLHHEIMHSFDTFIKTYTGLDINRMLGITNFDREIVHGAHPKAKYIRHKENTEWLAEIKAPLRVAYSKRRELYKKDNTRTLQLQVITLAQQAIVLLRQLLNRKNGVSR